MHDSDRFQPPDEPEVIVAHCAFCGGEIYANDEMTTYYNSDQTHGKCENEYVTAELGIVRYQAY